jgi:GAF domain
VGNEEDLHRTRQAVLAGRRPLRQPRPLIKSSWQRMLTQGLDPGADPAVPPLGEPELERRRARSAVAPLLPQLRAALQPAIEAGGLLMVVTDTDGRVLWRSGQPGIRRMADELGFVGGSAWTEGNVGTNAIGTCLVLGSPVHVQGAEHYVETHTRWGCAAAPLHDPWTGHAVGVLDVSGPAPAMHPAVLALVKTAARLAALEARNEHSTALERLRAHAAPLVARAGGRSLVVDQYGHVAAASGMPAPQRVALPDGMTVGSQYLPAIGTATAEALPGGWLLRLPDGDDGDAPPTHLELDLTAAPPQLQVHGPAGSWTHTLTPRHAEIMLSLVVNGNGRSAAELAGDLFADSSRAITVRAEMARLRRVLGPVLGRQPYRIDEHICARLLLPPSRQAVLPGSSAPISAALREQRRHRTGSGGRL